ncbi:hypothetical protein M231_06157 [Tremella mesenterica]|uniref:Signal recognition particle subunit SRP14 n=1 Tax=Tremella mesenterica TaxID=5217 RepID=A0A4Q1BED2_TREME|nr:hypothetical protein M231_06157 [Tremella mesenterica]
MPRETLTPQEFRSRLEECFTSSSTETIWLTHKRYIFDSMDQEEGHEVLLRCTHGQTKFSTRIPPSSLLSFLSTYSSLLKSSMAPRMRKRDKKREKARAEATTKKRRETYTDVILTSEGKRGKGRRQRQRKVLAQKKKEAERERLESLPSKDHS